jgi:hypothetical protein
MTFTDHDLDRISLDNFRKYFYEQCEFEERKERMANRAALKEYVKRQSQASHCEGDRDKVLVDSIYYAMCRKSPRLSDHPEYIRDLAEALYDQLMNEGRLIPRSETE